MINIKLCGDAREWLGRKAIVGGFYQNTYACLWNSKTVTVFQKQ